MCTAPGCRAFVYGRGSRCSSHPYPFQPDPRPSASARGYSTHWHQTSARFLRSHPWCRGCGSRATVADHVIPRDILIARGVAHPDADDQLQPLCRSCHAIKTGEETRRRRLGLLHP
jgi:5-methylcytosine-specific restriction protein A